MLEGDLIIRGGGDPRLTYERLWRIAHAAARARPARDPRRHRDRPQLLRARSPTTRPRSTTSRAAPTTSGTDALLVNFQAIDFRFVPDGRAACAWSPSPTSPTSQVVEPHRAQRREPCRDWRRDLKSRVHRGTACSATVSSPARSRAPAARRPGRSRVFDGRALRRERRCAGSGARPAACCAARCAPAPVPAGGHAAAAPRVRAARQPGARDQQVLEQRDGAPHLPRALGRARRRRRRGAGERARACATGSRRAPSRRRARDRERRRACRAPTASAPPRSPRVLRSAWASAVMPELVSSLPVLAVDGTLKSRDAGAAAGQAHLKGGTLTGRAGDRRLRARRARAALGRGDDREPRQRRRRPARARRAGRVGPRRAARGAAR